MLLSRTHIKLIDYISSSDSENSKPLFLIVSLYHKAEFLGVRSKVL